MPKVEQLVGQVKGMNQDAPRDSLPKGTVWNLHDILPSSRGANLRGRGQWRFRSTAFPGSSYPDVGLFANFENLVRTTWSGDKPSHESILRAVDETLRAAAGHPHSAGELLDRAVLVTRILEEIGAV